MSHPAEPLNLIEPLIAMARLAGAFDGRRPAACGDDRRGGLEAINSVHDAIWDGRGHEPARARETRELIDAYWAGYRAARTPSEARS